MNNFLMNEMKHKMAGKKPIANNVVSGNSHIRPIVYIDQGDRILEIGRKVAPNNASVR